MWLHKFIPQPCFGNAGAGGEGASGAGVGVGSGDRGYGGFGESAGYGGGGQVGGVSEGIGGGGIGAFGSGAGSGSGGGFTPGEMSYSGGSTVGTGPSRTSGSFAINRSPDMVSGAQAGTGLLGSGDRGYGGFGEGVGGYSDRGNQNAAGAGASGQAGVGGLGSGEGSGPNGAQAAAAAAAAGRDALAASSPSRNPVSVTPIAPPPKVVPPPAPVKTPTVVAPPPAVVKAPTIAAPTAAQLQALNTMRTVAPVTAANASVYGPAAMMSVPTSAPTMAQAVAAVNSQVANKASTASPNPGSMGPMDSPNTTAGSGYGSLADRAAQAQRDATRGLGMGPGGVGGVAPGNAGGFGAVSGNNPGGGGPVGGGGMGANNDGPSFSGGPQSNVSAKGDLASPSGYGPSGNSVLGQSRSNSMIGQDDPSTNATGFSAAPGLESRLGMLNSQLNNNAAMQTMEAFGVPTLASSPQADLARGQFRAENPPASRPTAELTVTQGILSNPTQTPNTAAKRDLEAPNTAFSVHSKTPMDDTLSSVHGIQQQPNRPAKRDLEQQISTPLSQETLDAASAFNEAVKAAQRNPYGTPAQRDPNAQLAAYGQTNPTISAPGQTSPTSRASLAGALNQMAERQAAQQAQAQRAQQAQASTAEIGGLLSQMGGIPTSASAPTNEEMPGSVRDNMRETSIVKGLLDAARSATTGGAATDAQGQTNDVENDGQVPDEPVMEASLGNQPTDETGGATSGPEAALEKVQGANSNFSEAYQTAKNMIGMGEVPDRATLMEFFEKGGIPSDPVKEAWCATFVNAALGVNGISGTNSKLARSFLEWGTPTDDPQPGDIVVFKRGNSNWQGHVGFFQGFDKNGNIRVLGGNQRNAVNVRTYSKKNLLGYRTLPQSGGGDASPQESELGIILQNAGIDIGSIPNTQNQQGYSQTPEGQWTDGAQTFSDPMEAISSLPVMDQLRLWMAWNRGSIAPPEGRSNYDRGSDNPFMDQSVSGLLSSRYGRNSTSGGGGSGGSGSGSDGSGSGSGSGTGGTGGTGGGAGSGTGNGNGTPPVFTPPAGWDPRNLGLLYRPYSNPFFDNYFGDPRNPWTWAA